MNCDDAQLTLWPDPRQAALSWRAVRALVHYWHCAPCRRFFEAQRRLGARLRRLAATLAAPARIHRRLLRLLGEASERQRY